MSNRARPTRLDGGWDGGAVRTGAKVLRKSGAWTPAVHALLRHLAAKGFSGAPQAIGMRDDGLDEVSYLAGVTIGSRRPWPSWVHTDHALSDVANWLRRYHEAVADFVPPPNPQWRESRAVTDPDAIIAHNDAAPYNAAWQHDDLVGFIDWDMAGPRSRTDDLAWTAFSWVPLHARHVVTAEGFTDFGRRRDRLARFLAGYQTRMTPDAVLGVVARLLTEQVSLMRDMAAAGDEVYGRMLEAGRALDLQRARAELNHV